MLGTYEIGLDTPIHMLTPRQLFEMQSQWMAERMPAQKSETKHWYVNSMDELAKILGTSVSTLYRMKSDGLLDDAISQYGKWYVINVDMVIDRFRLSNRQKKRRP